MRSLSILMFLLLPLALYADDMSSIAHIAIFMLGDVPVFFVSIIALIFTWICIVKKYYSKGVSITNTIFMVIVAISEVFMFFIHLILTGAGMSQEGDISVIFFVMASPNIFLAVFAVYSGLKLRKQIKLQSANT